MERRQRSWPVRFELFKPTRFSNEESVMYYAHEWEAYQKSVHHDQQATTPADAITPATTDATLTKNVNHTARPAENTAAAVTPAPVGISAEPVPNTPEPAAPNSHFVPSPPEPSSSTTSISPASSVTSSTSLTSSTSSTSYVPPDFSRHSRRCCICLHPDRDAIEGDFIRWRSPELIAREYKIANRTSIYRHAHCAGLFAWRRRELGRVLEGILENAEHVPLEASDAIVRAARVYAHLDENGNWFEPARINFVLTGPVPPISRPESFQAARQLQTNRRIAKRPVNSRSSLSRGRASVSTNQNSARRSSIASARQVSNRNSRQFRKKVK
jgi:hypothetical protein